MAIAVYQGVLRVSLIPLPTPLAYRHTVVLLYSTDITSPCLFHFIYRKRRYCEGVHRASAIRRPQGTLGVVFYVSDPGIPRTSSLLYHSIDSSLQVAVREAFHDIHSYVQGTVNRWTARDRPSS